MKKTMIALTVALLAGTGAAANATETAEPAAEAQPAVQPLTAEEQVILDQKQAESDAYLADLRTKQAALAASVCNPPADGKEGAATGWMGGLPQVVTDSIGVPATLEQHLGQIQAWMDMNKSIYDYQVEEVAKHNAVNCPAAPAPASNGALQNGAAPGAAPAVAPTPTAQQSTQTTAGESLHESSLPVAGALFAGGAASLAAAGVLVRRRRA